MRRYYLIGVILLSISMYQRIGQLDEILYQRLIERKQHLVIKGKLLERCNINEFDRWNKENIRSQWNIIFRIGFSTGGKNFNGKI